MHFIGLCKQKLALKMCNTMGTLYNLIKLGTLEVGQKTTSVVATNGLKADEISCPLVPVVGLFVCLFYNGVTDLFL